MILCELDTSGAGAGAGADADADGGTKQDPCVALCNAVRPPGAPTTNTFCHTQQQDGTALSWQLAAWFHARLDDDGREAGRAARARAMLRDMNVALETGDLSARLAA